MKLELGQVVYHEKLYWGKEPMKVVGIREKEVELEGDYSGGTHAVCQKDWLPIEGILLSKSETMTTEQNEIKSAEWRKKNLSKNSFLDNISVSLQFSEREVDFAYLCGVFNTSGIDGLYTEIQRLKELGKEPHDIIEACRKQ